MQISVSGQKVEVGKALTQHIEENLEGSVSKYFDRAIDADVVLTKEAHLFRCTIVVNEGTGTGTIIRAHGEGNDAYGCFDGALERVEKQLRRYKRRLKNHHKKKAAELMADKYVISPTSGEKVKEDNDNPLIIAQKQTTIETLSVSDAVMRMDLTDLPALLFINEKTGNINIVYQRKDGNITWVDSSLKSATAKSA